MVDGEHIDVGIAVTGASAAAGEAKKVEDALQEMKQAAAPPDGNPMSMPPAFMGPAPEAADRTRELAEATRQSSEATAQAAKETALLTDEQKRTAEEAGKAAKEFTDEAVKQLEAAKAAKEHEKALRETALATRMMVGLQVAEQLKPYLDSLSKLISESRAFGNASNDVSAALDASSASLSMATAGLATFIATGNPVIGLLAATATGAAAVAEAWRDMKTAQDLAAKSGSAAAESQKRLAEARERWTAGIGARSTMRGLEIELDILLAQEATLNRQVAARQRLSDAQNEAASLEVRMARATGGDVAAAEANALATQLATGLQKLEGELAKSKTRMEIASREYAKLDAELNYQVQTLKDSSSDEYKRIQAARDQAKAEMTEASDALTEQSETFRYSRQNLIRSVEVNLAETEKEYGAATSAAAKKGFDAVYQQLVSAQAGQADAVSKISADMGAVTAAVDAKAAEVKAAQDAHAAATVQSIGTLAPQPAQADAVAGAVREVGAKLEASGTATISALQQVANIAADQDRRIKVIDEKLKVLSARIR